jgi:hypothetical protein
MAWYCGECGELGTISGDQPKGWCTECHANEWRYKPTPPGRVTRYPSGLEGLERVMNSIRNGLGMRETEIARDPS